MPDAHHGIPIPKAGGPLQPFWDHTREGRLAIQRCKECAHMHFPPGPVCPQCLCEEQEWVAASGRGTVYSWCEFHHAYWDSVRPHLPYNVTMVKLEEGPVLMSNLVNADDRPLALGMPVRVIFAEVASDVKLPQFEPT